MTTLVLASASPARARLLRDAGVRFDVVVSGVDEDLVQTGLGPDATTSEVAVGLAEAKARAAATTLLGRADPDTFVVGCDSVLDLDGTPLGKPSDAADARIRWQQMRGRAGALRTGHAVVHLGGNTVRTAVASTVVRFASPSDEEIDAYIATGEPLGVAGAFTLDGLSAPFVEGIDGDPSNVIGLSLPLLRRLLATFGVRWTDLWSASPIDGFSSGG